MKTAVLGAGVSGLTAALKLQDKGDIVVVYEQDDRVGGLAKSRITKGYTYDPHGGHIFNSKHKEIVDFVFSYLPKEKWTYTVRNAKIFFSGKYVSYPFELSLCELEPEHAVECAYDYMNSQQGDEPTNFKDWLTWNFGESIANYYMLPYNTKIWSYPLEDMETGWMRGKMPLPEKKEILSSLVMKDPSERKMPHSTFYYPTEGGIQTMVDALAKPLDVRLNSKIVKIEKKGEKWIINDGEEFDRVISTIPLPHLVNCMELPSDVVNCLKDLKYNSLTSILFDCPKTDISWLYIPSSEYKSHRVGYQSALTPCATPDGNGSGALEIIGDKFEFSDDFIQINNPIPKELQAKSIIDSEFTEYAYVIHDKNYSKNTAKIHDYFANVGNFHLLGRWGRWNYNNMDLCMLDAFKLVETI